MPSPALTSANKFLPKQSKGTNHILGSHLKDELEIGVAEMALQVAPGQVQILYWASIFSQNAEGVVSIFISFFSCIISPVGVVGQPVVGRHQQVDRVDLWRLGNHGDDDDDDDFRLW